MIRILKQHLQDALKGLTKVVCGRASLPVLACVRIRSAGGKATISGTDLDQWLDRQVPVEGITEAIDCITRMDEIRDFIEGGDAKSVIGIEMSGKDSVRFSMDVGGHRMERDFEVISLAEWPLHRPEPRDMTPISKDIFAMIRMALPTASKNETRKIITGVCLDKDGIGATDGKHLVRFECILPLEQQAILPPAKVFSTGLFKDDGAFGVTMDKDDLTHVHFKSGPWSYTTRCICGIYPDFQQVTPGEESLKNSIVFTADDIAALAKSLPMVESVELGHAGVLLYAGSRGVKFMSMKPKSTAMLDTGAKYAGIRREMIAGIGRDYVLRAFELGISELRFVDEYSPFVFRSPKVLYVFMPLRNLTGLEASWKRIGIKPEKEETMKTKTLETAAQAAGQNGTQAQKAVQAPATDAPASEPLKDQKQGLTMVGTEADPFEDLAKAADEAKTKLRDAFESVLVFQRKIRDAQKNVRAKEKNYRSTRELVEKFRAVSNF